MNTRTVRLAVTPASFRRTHTARTAPMTHIVDRKRWNILIAVYRGRRADGVAAQDLRAMIFFAVRAAEVA